MRYAEASAFLYSLAPRGISLGLPRVHEALAQRGHPERACPALLVAGTNGKGSVVAMLASMLQAEGLRVGTYTSPHLHRIVERFRIAGRPLSEREFVARVRALRPWLVAPSTPELTFFEACTVLAFEAFRAARCDVMVLEVGLGGRLDATNVVTPLATVITKIALDHAERLGPTLRHIAREKAGIIKRGVPLVTAVREPEARSVIRARARRLGAPMLEVERDFGVQVASLRGARPLCDVRVQGELFSGLPMPLRGDYQSDNLGCAVATLVSLRAHGIHVSERAMRAGLRRVRWPGRLELVTGAPATLFDAAHNPDACAALARELSALSSEYTKRVLLFGVMRDKEVGAMLAVLSPQVDAVVFATPDTERALPARELAVRFHGQAVGDPVRAYRKAATLAGKRGLVVAAGSIFLMAAVRAHVLGEKSDPPIAM